ncbi:hypothetical protein FRC02_001745 [Tulasnella sp. 418]|nr:hypothetical protein FRC02_001745 [Tulasnella sp. 418]
MSSLFSRVRSSKKQPQSSQTLPISNPYSPESPSDEFGRVKSFGDPAPFATPQPKQKDRSIRQRTMSTPGTSKDLPPHPPTAPLPRISALPSQEGGFLPLYIPHKKDAEGEKEYGYLSAENRTVLQIDDVTRLVTVVGDEIMSRALDTPLLFSTLALDVSAPRVRSLARSFLATCHRPSAHTGELRWREDVRLAGPHELGMVLRWGLARLLRLYRGQEVRGVVEWDLYVQWREDEEALKFPANHFPAFLSMAPAIVRPLLENLFSLFSRLAAYSSSSGLTPIALSSLFGPLLFGLGYSSAPFSQTYQAYLRSSHAAEHLILSYIRNVEVESRNAAVGMPSRLKDWIRGYPIMIPPLRDLEKPRRGCKLVKVASVRRNVRLYSPDLVKTSASWAGEGDLSGRKEWSRVTSRNLPPKYTDAYRKRLDIPHSYAPSISSVASSTSFESTRGGTTITASSRTLGLLDDVKIGNDGLGAEDADRFGSLTELRWGEFEQMGFSEPSTKMLEFDLNESARMTRAEKRATMTWSDFSASGFSRNEMPLSATLQFSTPISSTISTWPTHAEDIHRKLKKTQKVLPTFGWDTTPVAGQEWTIEEGFVSCWADLVLSSGWMEREEGTFRDSNWALIEFKAIPTQITESESGLLGTDPRTSSQWFLFEEFVPREYREQLINPPKKGKGTIFTSGSNKNKGWKPAQTVNGKPYTGRPRSPNAREAEFDALLRASASESKTRLISLSNSSNAQQQPRSHTLPPVTGAVGSRSQVASPGGGGMEPRVAFPPSATSFRSGGGGMDGIASPTSNTNLGTTNQNSNINSISFSESYGAGPSTVVTPQKEKGNLGPGGSGFSSRFKIPGRDSVKRSSGLRGSEYDPDLEFEIRTASDSSGELLSTPVKPRGLAALAGSKHGRKHSKDDAWVDILVAGQRRMANQDSPSRPMGNSNGTPDNGSLLRTPRTSLNRARSDPELAREEIARALAIANRATVDFGNDVDDEDDLYDSQAGHGGYQQHQQRRGYGSEEEEEVMEVPSIVRRQQSGPAIHVRSASESSEGGLPYDRSSYPPRRPHYRSDEEADDEDEPISPPPPPPLSKDGHTNGTSNAPLPNRTPSPNPPAPEPTTPENQIAQPQGRRPGGGNGVSSLIQMYGKKDQDAAAGVYHAKTPPSKLPVRSLAQSNNPLLAIAAMHQQQSPSPTSPVGKAGKMTDSPSPVHSRDETPSPPPPQPSPQETYDLPPRLSPSPALPRYVHGAPLHNVMEEESE